MLEDYIPILLMLIVGSGVAAIFLVLSRSLGPRRPTDEKLSTYESGMEPVRTARERFSVKYYMVAVLFILFDIEVVFLYPWAVQYKALGWFAFIEMFIFIFILFIGYFYILKKGALRWD
jgi:NADH-quinone oxidoreductase subunit A